MQAVYPKCSNSTPASHQIHSNIPLFDFSKSSYLTSNFFLFNQCFSNNQSLGHNCDIAQPPLRIMTGLTEVNKSCKMNFPEKQILMPNNGVKKKMVVEESCNPREFPVFHNTNCRARIQPGRWTKEEHNQFLRGKAILKNLQISFKDTWSQLEKNRALDSNKDWGSNKESCSEIFAKIGKAKRREFK